MNIRDILEKDFDIRAIGLYYEHAKNNSRGGEEAFNAINEKIREESEKSDECFSETYLQFLILESVTFILADAWSNFCKNYIFDQDKFELFQRTNSKIRGIEIKEIDEEGIGEKICDEISAKDIETCENSIGVLEELMVNN